MSAGKSHLTAIEEVDFKCISPWSKLTRQSRLVIKKTVFMSKHDYTFFFKNPMSLEIRPNVCKNVMLRLLFHVFHCWEAMRYISFHYHKFSSWSNTNLLYHNFCGQELNTIWFFHSGFHRPDIKMSTDFLIWNLNLGKIHFLHIASRIRCVVVIGGLMFLLAAGWGSYLAPIGFVRSLPRDLLYSNSREPPSHTSYL